MQHATSYQHCVAPDPEGEDNRMIIAIAEWVHEGDTAEDVRINAHRIAHKVNQAHGGRRDLLDPSDVRELAEQAVYFSTYGSLP